MNDTHLPRHVGFDFFRGIDSCDTLLNSPIRLKRTGEKQETCQDRSSVWLGGFRFGLLLLLASSSNGRAVFGGSSLFLA